LVRRDIAANNVWWPRHINHLAPHPAGPGSVGHRHGNAGSASEANPAFDERDGRYGAGDSDAGSDGLSTAGAVATGAVVTAGLELEPEGPHATTAATLRTSMISKRFMRHLLMGTASTMADARPRGEGGHDQP
jgi:hypothetical protein